MAPAPKLDLAVLARQLLPAFSLALVVAVGIAAYFASLLLLGFRLKAFVQRTNG